MKTSRQVALVTGGGGFLGTALIRELTARGVTVHALCKRNQESLAGLLPSSSIHMGNGGLLQVADLVQEINPSTIFHLATVFKEPENPTELEAIIEGNLTLGIALLFAASQQKKAPAFINAGTYWQFGDNSRTSLNCLYAATKRSFHEVLVYFRDKYRMSAVTLILYDTFGANDPRPKLWRRLVAAAPGTDIPLTKGEQTIHLLHVTDVVRAFLGAADLLEHDHPLEPIYSAHSFRPQKLKDLVTEFSNAACLDLKLNWGALPYPKDQIFDPWVGKSLPGWEPRVDVIEALVEYAHMSKGNARVRGVHIG